MQLFRTLIHFLFWALLSSTNVASAQSETYLIDSNRFEEVPVDAVLTQLILNHMPIDYLDEKKWGQQEKRWDGIQFRREGLKLETKRRWKLVNHGTWRKYHAALIDPEKQFSAVLTNLHNLADGKTAFDLNIHANLKLHARQAKWVKGVQLYSISADGKCHIQIKLSCQTQILLGLGHFPPDLIFRPRVVAVTLAVDEFRLDRISKVGGEVAQQITKWVQDALNQKIEEQPHQLIVKLNAKIEQNHDELRLSLVEAMQSKWMRQSTAFLPESVQTALQDR